MNVDYVKLEIFLPRTHLEVLAKTLYQADAGHIGRYDCCLSYSPVRSTWRPLSGTNPYLGEENVISEEEEFKVEVTIRYEKLQDTIQAIKEVHPYEEPVINVIPLLLTGV